MRHLAAYVTARDFRLMFSLLSRDRLVSELTTLRAPSSRRSMSMHLLQVVVFSYLLTLSNCITVNGVMTYVHFRKIITIVIRKLLKFYRLFASKCI